MNSTQSPAAPPFDNQRKQELLDRIETNFDEIERWRQFNAAYHDDDRKFMRFLMPPGKRVLELGCGSGHMLAALEPSLWRRRRLQPEDDREGQDTLSPSDFCRGRRRRPGDARCHRRAVRLHRARRHHRAIRRHRRHVAVDPSALRAVDTDHHRLLLPSLGAGPESSPKRCGCATSSRRSTISPPPTS